MSDLSILTKKDEKKAHQIKPYKLSMNTDDSWKDALQVFFKDFMEFAWPDIYREIDWDKGFEFLDKELQSLVKYQKKGKRHVDKLVKVWHKYQGEIFVILHIEVQSQKEAEFSMRIFNYYYRLWDRYKVPIVSLVVLIDNNKNWRPDIYEAEIWNCQIHLKYPILKLIDYESKIDMLKKSDNPFALVVLCQLFALRSIDNANLRFDLKFSLSKALLKKKWDRNKVIALLRFLDGIMRLPEPLELEFINDLKNEVEKKDMSYVTSFEYFAALKGFEQGEQKGEQKGIQKGESRLLLSQLQSKFKTVPKIYIKRVQQANPDILLTWANRVLWANTIEEVFS